MPGPKETGAEQQQKVPPFTEGTFDPEAQAPHPVVLPEPVTQRHKTLLQRTAELRRAASDSVEG